MATDGVGVFMALGCQSPEQLTACCSSAWLTGCVTTVCPTIVCSAGIAAFCVCFYISGIITRCEVCSVR